MTDESMQENPFCPRVEDLVDVAREKRLGAVFIFNEYNRLSLTGVCCDNGCIVLSRNGLTFYTDFRYTVMAKRVAPWLKTCDMWNRSNAIRMMRKAVGNRAPSRIGYEGSISARQYLLLQKAFPDSRLVDIEGEMSALRAVKTYDEIVRIATAEALNDKVWQLAKRQIRPGMSEKEIQRVIRALMNEYGDGEAFETIVCAGANAAECHHVPDGTVWRRGESLLVDMGIKIDGVCSDMTRNIRPPKGKNKEYDRIYDIVLKANEEAIAQAKPGMRCKDLDGVARRIIEKAGYGKAFGHSLGHGVGYEIHEHPVASSFSEEILVPGMIVTIEPGIYIPGSIGVRIEDLVLITEEGATVLSSSAK